MSKRLFLLSLLSIGWLSGTLADNGTKTKKAKGPLKHKADTSVITRTGSQPNPTINSGNQSFTGYSDLYLTASLNISNGSRLNPRAVSFVEDYATKNKEELLEIREHGKYCLDLMDAILTRNGLPGDLKYLAVIESNLKTTCVSQVGAVGPWQLMPATARILGLKVNRHVDERTNVYKSTQAASRYLKDLYTEFGDWLLVIAAYNGGTANVYNAIKKSHSTNFWNLQYYLPAESRNHVKKFIGTHYVYEGQGSVTTLTKDEATQQLSGSTMYVFTRNLTKEEQKACKTLTVSGKYVSTVIAKNILMDLTAFNRYNPEFDKVMASSNNTYELKLPADKMDLFLANKYQILNESVQLLAEETADNDTPKILRDIASIGIQ